MAPLTLLGSLPTLLSVRTWASSYSPRAGRLFYMSGYSNFVLQTSRRLAALPGFWDDRRLSRECNPGKKQRGARNQTSAICHCSLPRPFIVLDLLGLGSVLMQPANHSPVHSRKCHSRSLCRFAP